MLERSLREAMNRALERWPKIEVTFDAYLAFVQRSVDPSTDISTLALEDMCLATGCLHADPHALKYFEQDILRHVSGAISRVDGRLEFVDEVRQRLRQRLLVQSEAKIAEYRGRGSLLNWVRVAAVRTALNVRAQDQRLAARQSDDDDSSQEYVDSFDVETESFKAQYRPALVTAVRRACIELSDRDRTILRLHTLDGYSIDKLAVAFGVHRATAARWIHKAQVRLKEAVRTQLKQEAGVQTADAMHIERILRSQLTTSFSGLQSQAKPLSDE